MTSSELGGLALSAALRLLARSWRLHFEFPGSDPLQATRDRAQIAALWHCDLLIAAAVFRDRGFSVALSRSRDGDRARAALVRLGYSEPARGSSSRGGAAALLGLVKRVRRGISVSITTDGPQGPAQRSKDGVAILSRICGIPITPVGFEARPCLRFRSWDQTRLPLPFSRVICRYGEPIAVAADAGDDAIALALRELDASLFRLGPGAGPPD